MIIEMLLILICRIGSCNSSDFQVFVFYFFLFLIGLCVGTGKEMKGILISFGFLVDAFLESVGRSRFICILLGEKSCLFL